MRVAVVTSPRTGSTFACEYISVGLNLKNYEELLNNIFDEKTFTVSNTLEVVTNEEIIQQLTTTDDYVVKFITSMFFDRKIDLKTFPWHIFDKIILLERQDIVTQIVSWYTLDYWQQFIINRGSLREYHITDDFINFAIDGIKKYYELKDTLLKCHKEQCVVVEKKHVEETITKMFNIQDFKNVIDVSNSNLDLASKETGVNYEVMICSQNLRKRVLQILEKELWKN